MAVADITAARLRELFHYNPDTGEFTRRVQVASRARVGQVAGSPTNGYLYITVDYKRAFAHRLAWLYMTGEWPKGQIDHINRIKNDNRFANLRDVTPRMNNENLSRGRVKGFLLGVSSMKTTKKYRARIHVAGKEMHLGLFHTIEEAHAAYLQAKRRLHEGCTI